VRVIDTVGMGARFEAVPLKIPAVPQPGREAIRFRFAAGHLWHKLRFVLDSPLEGSGFEPPVPACARRHRRKRWLADSPPEEARLEPWFPLQQ